MYSTEKHNLDSYLFYRRTWPYTKRWYLLIYHSTVVDFCDLVAVCDIKAKRANDIAKKYNAKAYTDYKEMFQAESLDAVHICPPHYLHLPCILKAKI